MREIQCSYTFNTVHKLPGDEERLKEHGDLYNKLIKVENNVNAKQSNQVS